MARTEKEIQTDKTVGDILASQKAPMVSRGVEQDKLDALGGSGSVDAAKLKTSINRIEAAIEKAALANAAVKDEYARAENAGFDKKALKAAIKHRGNTAGEEHRITVNAYMKALGELPLFAVAEVH